MALSERLGDAAARQRRHRKFAGLGIALLVLAGVFMFIGREDDDSGDDGGTTDSGETATDAPGAAGVCARFSDRVQDEYQLSFPDGAPLNDEAAAQYLSTAFADTMDDLVVALRAEELDGDLTAVVDDLATRIDEVRATPGDYLQANPLGDLVDRFDAADLAACGSEFFGASE